jgi:hypothetical chaperone protein
MTNQISYGIDFGTTNSTVAIIDSNKSLSILPIDQQSSSPTVMRSVIYADPDGSELFYGGQAIKQYLANVSTKHNTEYKNISSGRYIKALSSQGTYELIPEITEIEVNPSGRLLQSLKSALSNQSISKVNLFGKIYPIEVLIGMFLREMKRKADLIVNEDVKSVVIGRPVEYVGSNNKLALSRMQKAAEFAGFTKVDFELEPIAAAYDYSESRHSDEIAVIFDFGGGTLDISAIKLPEKKILFNFGLKIGGDKFDAEIFADKLSPYFGSEVTYGMSKIQIPRHIYNSLESWYGISLLKTRDFMNQFEDYRFMCSDLKALYSLKSLVFDNLGFKLYEEIEKVKKILSTNNDSSIHFSENNINIHTNLNRGEFEQIIKNDLNEIDFTIDTSLDAMGLNPSDVDTIVTTGGSSLIPAIQKILRMKFANSRFISSNTFTSVAAGLARIGYNKFK